MNKREKEREIKILQCLREDGRMQLTKMSHKTGIPVSTLHDYIKTSKLVKKYTALLDFAKIGYATRFYGLVSVHRDNRERAFSYLMAKPNINTFFKINNGYDFLFEGVFETLKEVEDFFEEFDKLFKVKAKEMHYIIDEYKREGLYATNEIKMEVPAGWR